MTMPSSERAEAISRARRAHKALNEHPDTGRRQLGQARQALNDCYNLNDPKQIWQAVTATEAAAARVYGVPRPDEQRTTANAEEPADRGHQRKAAVGHEVRPSAAVRI